MRDEKLHERAPKLVRRLQLKPGEAMPWHVDPYQRLTVFLQRSSLAIEYRNARHWELLRVEPGQTDGERPKERPDRGVKTGQIPLDSPRR